MNKELFYCYACEQSAPPVTICKEGLLLGEPHTYTSYWCSLCNSKWGTIREFKCCPYCTSTNIEEYEGDLQQGTCKDCNSEWYDSTYYCE